MRWPYEQIGVTTARAFRNLLNKVIGDIGADMQEHKDRADNIQAQVDNLVADGDSSPEAAQARVGADGTNYTTLKQRLDTENQSVTAQLADTSLDLSERGINVARNIPDVEDQTSHIQNLLDEAMQTGRSIFLPEREYVVTNLVLDYTKLPLVAYGFKGIKIFGNGKRNTVIRQADGATGDILSFVGAVGDRSHTGKLTGLLLEGVSIYGNGLGGSGIYIRSFNDLTIRDCYIQNCGADGIRIDRQIFDTSTGEDEYAYNLKIENTKIMLNGGWGINSVAQHAIGAATFDNCDIEYNSLGGININPSSVTLIGGSIIGNSGAGLKVIQTPSYPTSVTFGMNIYATRFEANALAGSHEIEFDGSWAPIVVGISVIASKGGHIFGMGGLTGIDKAVRQPTIIGGYYAGDKTTTGQKFLDVGVNTYSLTVINPRIDVNEFADTIKSKDMMDAINDLGTDTYILFGKNERTIRSLLGKYEVDTVLIAKLLNDISHRFRIQAGGTLSWGDGTNNTDTDLYRSGAGQLRTDGDFVSGGSIAPGATSAKIYSGTGSPEGVVSASSASLYLRADGVNGTLLYVKTTGTGSTGWVAKF